MMTRRHFLASLGIGLAALTLRLRQESTLPKIDRDLGFRGKQFFEAGYILAPYMPLFITRCVGGDSAVAPARRWLRPGQLHPSEVMRAEALPDYAAAINYKYYKQGSIVLPRA